MRVAPADPYQRKDAKAQRTAFFHVLASRLGEVRNAAGERGERVSRFSRNWTKPRERLAYDHEGGFDHGEGATDVPGGAAAGLRPFRGTNRRPLQKDMDPSSFRVRGACRTYRHGPDAGTCSGRRNADPAQGAHRSPARGPQRLSAACHFFFFATFFTAFFAAFLAAFFFAINASPPLHV